MLIIGEARLAENGWSRSVYFGVLGRVPQVYGLDIWYVAHKSNDNSQLHTREEQTTVTLFANGIS